MQYDDHVSAVLAATIPGVVAPPKDWIELRQRFTEFTKMESAAADRLALAVLDGDDDEIFELRVSALAEAAGQHNPQAAAAVTNKVRGVVLERLNLLYSAEATDIYGKIADRFDATAQKFTAAAELVDPEVNADEVVAANTKVRNAWTEAPAIAAELDRLLPALLASARLCGMTGHEALLTLPLTISTDGHRRTTWSAWDSKGDRCGRWSAIVAAGIEIRAARDPQAVREYRRPRDFIKRIETSGGVDRIVWDDPEDSDYIEPAAPFVYRPGAVAMRGR